METTYYGFLCLLIVILGLGAELRRRENKANAERCIELKKRIHSIKVDHDRQIEMENQRYSQK